MMSSGRGQLRLLRAPTDDITAAPADVTAAPGAAPAGAEARMHLRVARFIMEAGVKLGLGSVPLATACAAYHRFAGAVGPGAPYDPHLVAAAALFLAGKAEGQPLRARDVLNVAHRCLHPGQPPPGLDGGFWRCATAWCSASCCCCACCASASPSPTPTSTCCTTCWRWGSGAGGGAGGTRGCRGRPGRCCGMGRRGGWGCGTPPSTWPPPPLHLGLALCGRPPPPGAPPRWWQVLSPTLGPEELEQIVRELLELYSLDAEVGGAPPAPPRPTDGRAGDRGTPAPPQTGTGLTRGHRDGHWAD